jgi:amino acid adenylation domain-containing protein
MLLHTLGAPGTGVYVLQMLVATRETLDVPLLERALRRQVEWHPTLRTSFWLDDPDGPSQSVRSGADVVVQTHDLRHLDEPGRRAGVRAYLDADKARSFDLADGRPPMRYAVIRTGDDEYTFVWTLHHALMDGRSCTAVMIELFVMYDRMRAGRVVELQTRRPYADYVTWLSTQDLRAAEAFWRAMLAGFTEPTPLAVDAVRELGAGEAAFGAAEVELAEATTARLYALADQHRVTANNFVQAAWAVLLHQLSGRRDVVFGTTRACRSFTEGADAMIGLLVNTLPFRALVDPETTVVELLGRLRRDQVRLRGFEHASPAQIRRWTGFSSPGALFDSVVTFENHRYATYFRSMVAASDCREAGFEGYASFPLTLSAYRDACLALHLGYDRRRFTDTVALRLLTHLRALLEAMTRTPHATLATLASFPPADADAEAADADADAGAGAEREAFWVERLAGLEPLCLPLRRRAAGPPGQFDQILVEAPNGPAVDRRPAGRAADRAEWLLTGVLTFLVRYTGEDSHDVEVSWPVERGAGTGPDGGWAGYLPLRVPPMAGGRDFAAVRADLGRHLDLLAGRGTYRGDVWARYPRLRARAALARDGLPVVVELVEDLTAPAVTRPGTVLLVQIPRDGGACRLLVSCDASCGGTAADLRARLVAYLRAAAHAVGTDVTRLPMMPQRERRRLLVDWNDTAVDHPREECVHQLFTRQARRRPDAPAVVFDGRTLTYRELDHRSTRLAAFLARRGAGPGTLVGVHLERSAEVVVALLAIMRTGAAFVPLDPVYPPDRIARIVAASGVPLLLTQAGLAGDVRGLPTRVVSLDRERHAIARSGDSYPDRATPDGLAYLIFTSGSTGPPKGVRVGHRGLTNLLCSLARTPGCTERDRLLAVTTICFDMAYAELFLPLVAGGCVEVVAADVAADGLRLRRQLEESRPTVMQATPVTWRMLIAAGWTGDHRLRVMCGGEAMSRDLADGLLDRAGQVWNLYGPTEATVFASVAAVTRDQPVTIGRPVDNTRLHVLDARGELVPPGTPGELYIGGDGLAAGYLGDPDLTRARFVCAPACGDALLYRTGDRVRRLPDGRIEFLDRLDDQIKINGYRIEPGEVEAALRGYPGVAEALVVVREDTAGVRRLVGYLAAADPDRAVPTARLREHLMAALPRYLLPAVLVTVPRLPRTPNGKVDRRALPPPTAADLLPSGVPHVAPRNQTERAVAAIWRGVLGVGSVGIDENFFDVGGDSMMLMHLAARLRTEFGESLTQVDMFVYPTIRAMARHLRASSPDRTAADAADAADAAGAPAGDGAGRHAALDELRRRRLALPRRPGPAGR